jgi:hypothetical protein
MELPEDHPYATEDSADEDAARGDGADLGHRRKR